MVTATKAAQRKQLDAKKAEFHSVPFRGGTAGKDRGAGEAVQALGRSLLFPGFLASDRTVGFLIKPFSGDELLDAVDATLKWKPTNSGEALEFKEVP